MFRREIGFETGLMVLSLRWRRHDAQRFASFGKQLILAIAYGAGGSFDVVDEFGRCCRPVASSRIREASNIPGRGYCFVTPSCWEAAHEIRRREW
jgi:hypothetical protein